MFEEIFAKIARNDFQEGDTEISAFLRDAAKRGLSDEQLIRFTKAIAESSRHNGSHQETGVTDIPSTGGPSSLSTLVAPLLVAISGGKILKVSATGRPAGAIDVLQTLPGYRAQLSSVELARLLSRSSYVHLLQTDEFVPADRKLIAMRRASNTMSSPDLAIASLLSKKLCVSVTRFVADIRVGASGNVGEDVEGAVRFSKRFVDTANRVGCKVRCVLTDLRNWPQSPYWGRGESLAGLGHVLGGLVDRWTWESLRVLVIEALTLVDPSVSPLHASQRLEEALSKNPIRQVAQLLEEHGISKGTFEERLTEISEFVELPIRARSEGWIRSVDLEKLKNVVIFLYSAIPAPESGIPPWRIGLRWKLKEKRVARDQEVCSVRVREAFAHGIQSRITDIENQVLDCLSLQIEPPEEKDVDGVVLGVVDEHGKQRDTLAA